MAMGRLTGWLTMLTLVLGLTAPAHADVYFFTTGDTDGLIGTASRPESADGSKGEIESADDFILPQETLLYGAIFTGLVPAGIDLSDIGQVKVEIYRVFPNDSDTT